MLNRSVAALLGALAFALLVAMPAQATPVCTDGYKGGPPKPLCGNRIFPEAQDARAYIQYTQDPAGFAEYRDGVEHLAATYPRWVSVTTLREIYGDPDAVSAGEDGLRANDPRDTGDGRDIPVLKITDHSVDDTSKQALFFSLSVHGNERGGLEGGVRTAEDLAIAAACITGGNCPAYPRVCNEPWQPACPVSKAISDGVPNYTSTTGKDPEFRTYSVKTLLEREIVYMIDFNVDGWAMGDVWNPGLFNRGNSLNTDLNRQMPSVGRINWTRNPLQETEMAFGTRLMHEVADASPGNLMAYGADIHGELTSQAYMDIMYPAGQFDSVDHRRLMSIAERTKSVVDKTLYAGIMEEIEQNTTGNDEEAPQANVPQRPAHWATVWDTLGYTDSGYIGDYLATDLGVTGMDYEIAFNHTVPEKVWNVYLQENHINASRAIIKTAMAYALSQSKDFDDANVRIDPVGRAGYVVNKDTITDTDEDGAGRAPGRPTTPGRGSDGQPVEQRPYEATSQQWFRDTSRLMTKPFVPVASGDIAADPSALDILDTLVLGDVLVPKDPGGRSVNRSAYWANIAAWVQRGGNLVLTDRALHALEEMGIVGEGLVKDVEVYLPYANFKTFDHAMTHGLRSNARQLVESVILGYGINGATNPREVNPKMQVVDSAAWQAKGGETVATTGNLTGGSDNTAQTSVGQMKLGDGQIRIVGGALTTPTEANDHRYGLRDYAMTYSALFLMENSLVHDAPNLGTAPPRVSTRLSFTERSEQSGQYSDEAFVEARLTDAEGKALNDAVVVFDLVGGESASSWTAATGREGYARVPARLIERPGTYTLTARYAGDDDSFKPSSTQTQFTILREEADLTLARSGEGGSSAVAGKLVDADSGEGISDRVVQVFASDGSPIGSDLTEGDGRYSVAIPPQHRGAKETFSGRFDGDEFYRDATAATGGGSKARRRR
jgi:hypothetical protein